MYFSILKGFELILNMDSDFEECFIKAGFRSSHKVLLLLVTQ